mmetsp:Transcript_20896/g.52809  ORF Transcript_20896/g.52809 Transcript_20896/m.52809 type:complete len:316 (+) Transcript_20896:366-1313(+)
MAASDCRAAKLGLMLLFSRLLASRAEDVPTDILSPVKKYSSSELVLRWKCPPASGWFPRLGSWSSFTKYLHAPSATNPDTSAATALSLESPRLEECVDGSFASFFRTRRFFWSRPRSFSFSTVVNISSFLRAEDSGSVCAADARLVESRRRSGDGTPRISSSSVGGSAAVAPFRAAGSSLSLSFSPVRVESLRFFRAANSRVRLCVASMPKAIGFRSSCAVPPRLPEPLGTNRPVTVRPVCVEIFPHTATKKLRACGYVCFQYSRPDSSSYLPRIRNGPFLFPRRALSRLPADVSSASPRPVKIPDVSSKDSNAT